MNLQFNSQKERLNQIKRDLEAGEHARALRENPIFSSAFLAKKASLYDQYAKSKWYQRKLRESIWAQLQGVIAIEAALQSAEAAARNAMEEVEKMNAKKSA